MLNNLLIKLGLKKKPEAAIEEQPPMQIVTPIPETHIEEVKEVKEESVAEVKPVVEEPCYYIGFYTSNGTDRITGGWKLSKEEVDKQAESYLYKNKLGYTLAQTAKIAKSAVAEMAKEHNMTIGEVLSTIH